MAFLKNRSGLQGAALLFALVAIGCGPTPEKLGDECEADGDPCPAGSSCLGGGETMTCQVPMGGACDPAGADFCEGVSVCSADSKKCEIPLGGACEPGAADMCVGDSVCTASKTCEIPIGGACDPLAAQEHCEGDNVCGANPDGTGTCGIAEGGVCDPANDQCAGGLTCAEMQAGGFACYPPVLVKGMVFDTSTKGPVTGAQIMALDSQATAISDVVLTDDKGNYVMEVPVQRQADGSPIANVSFTLRASAKDYQTFPGGLRTALPLSSGDAKSMTDGWNLQSALTDIALIPVAADQKGLPSISGKVNADKSGGVLVVAEDAMSRGFSAISDKSGAYTIFNVPAGAYNVRGYAAGLQLTPAMTDVAMADVTGVDLNTSMNAVGSVSGTVSIVNAFGGAATSVVLVVASTFSDTFVRGEVPRGLRTPLSGPPNVTGAFTIADVPEGKYKVLAAFENDQLVRDPDPNIAGTQIVEVSMPSPGEAVTVANQFKITEALAVISPGAGDAAEPVKTAPMLTWKDDSSEDFYTVVVYNAYGELVWCLSDQMMGCAGGNIPSVSGGGNVSVPYGGPMEPGMYYQFRATAWRAPGGNPGPISNTEDLRGVFYVDVAAP